MTGEEPSRARPRVVVSHPVTSEARRAAFVAALAETGIVRLAAEAAGVHRGVAYRWRREDADFREAWDAAREEASDALEAEAWRRAVAGVRRPVFWQGEEVGEVVEYSDRLLELLLKARRPDVFRERSTVTHEGAVEARPLVVDIFSPAVQDAARALEEALAAESAVVSANAWAVSEGGPGGEPPGVDDLSPPIGEG